MTDEDGFLRKLLAAPADDTARLVYADWLEEVGTDESLAKAEFLRRQLRLREVPAGGPVAEAVGRRLFTLAGRLPATWLAAVGHYPVENCKAAGAPRPVTDLPLLRFDFQCPKDWAAMAPTDDPAVRHCDACRRDVYYCQTIGAARARAARGDCVAVSPALVRTPGDLDPPRRDYQMLAGAIAPD